MEKFIFEKYTGNNPKITLSEKKLIIDSSLLNNNLIIDYALFFCLFLVVRSDVNKYLLDNKVIFFFLLILSLVWIDFNYINSIIIDLEKNAFTKKEEFNT